MALQPNQVYYGDQKVMDISDSTVTPETLVVGSTAYDKSGVPIEGENPYEKAATDSEVNTQADLIGQIQTALENKAAPSGGIDTSDATATASDMPEGVTAYVKGEKVTGSLPVKTGLTLPFEDTSPNFVIATNSGRTQILMSNGCFDDFVFRPGESMFAGSTVTMNIPAEAMSQFGDATAEDVAAGKTFTSLYGVKLTGTKEEAVSKAVVLTAEATPTANSLILTFEGLSGEPTLFSIDAVETVTLGTTRFVGSVSYDGSNIIGSYLYKASSYGSATSTYSETAYSYTYADGKLTITSNGATTGGYFGNGITYRLSYVTDTLTSGETGGSSGTDTSDAIGTSTTTPSENSLSISFTGLTAQPKTFSIVPKSAIALSSSTVFALNVVYDGTNTIGAYPTSSGVSWAASFTVNSSTTAFTWEYSNGTLTITASSATVGGYFESGVAYQLTYVA